MRPHYPEPWQGDGSHVKAALATDGRCQHEHDHWHLDGSETEDEARERCAGYYHGTMIAESIDGPERDRIVACVNALAGVPTGALVEGWVGEMVDMVRRLNLRLFSLSDTPADRRLVGRAVALLVASGRVEQTADSLNEAALSLMWDGLTPGQRERRVR